MLGNGWMLKAGLALALAGAAAPVLAAGDAVDAAKAAGTVGEQSDGYLGFVKPPAPALRQAVDAVNIKRREIYTNIAASGGKGSVEAVATARGCEQLSRRVAPGEAYRIGSGPWQVRGSAPIALPAVCG